MKEDDPRLNILLIEDISSKTKLVREALERSQNRCKLHAVGAGPSTLEYLRQDGPYAAAPTPDLVLFDMSDAEKRHLKILDRVHADTSNRGIPLVLLTRPDSEDLVEETYNGQGDCVMFSPIDLDCFLQTMRTRTPDRFLGAVALIQKLGFVLVRVPSEFTEIQPNRSIAISH